MIFSSYWVSEFILLLTDKNLNCIHVYTHLYVLTVLETLLAFVYIYSFGSCAIFLLVSNYAIIWLSLWTHQITQKYITYVNLYMYLSFCHSIPILKSEYTIASKKISGQLCFLSNNTMNQEERMALVS